LRSRAQLVPARPTQPRSKIGWLADPAAQRLQGQRRGKGHERVPREMGCGSGMSCWRRLRDWQAAGVWDRLHELLLAKLREADRIDWSRVVVDSSSIRAVGAGQKRDPIPPTVRDQVQSTTSSQKRKASRSR